MNAPSESPATRHGARSSSSISPAASSAISFTEYGAGGQSDGRMPRLSNVITRYPAAVRAGTWKICQVNDGCPVPQTSRMGSPAPNTS